MAVTTEYSDEYEKINDGEFLDPQELGAKVRVAQINFAQGAAAGDADSLAYLTKLPAGKVTVLGFQSSLTCSAFGTGRTLDIGHGAYVDRDGDTQAEDLDDLDDGVDVSTATTLTLCTALATTRRRVFESQDGVDIIAQVKGATIPAAATLKGQLLYTLDG